MPGELCEFAALESKNLMIEYTESGGMLALTAQEAKSLGLDKSVPSPQDPSKEVYFLAAYHHVHCVVSVLVQTTGSVLSEAYDRRS